MQHLSNASVTCIFLIMPSPRKRIGFLPSAQVQDIIEKICIENQLSQSKVTGILVEEALESRGVLTNSLNKLSFNNNILKEHSLNSNVDNFNLKASSSKNDLEMINEFIEYKFFKQIMIKNRR